MGLSHSQSSVKGLVKGLEKCGKEYFKLLNGTADPLFQTYRTIAISKTGSLVFFWEKGLDCLSLVFINTNYRKDGIVLLGFFCVDNFRMKSFSEPWRCQKGKPFNAGQLIG